MSHQWRLYSGGHIGQISLRYGDTGTVLPVTGLAVGPDDTLWALFHNHILVYKDHRWQSAALYSQPAASPNLGPGMHWWRERLWLAGQGLWHYCENIVQRVNVLPEDRVIALASDDAHGLVVGFARAGIWCSRDGDAWRHIISPVDGGTLHALTYSEDHHIWIIMQAPIAAEHLTTVYADREWTTAPISVWRYDSDQLGWIANGSFPEPARVMTMLIDPTQALWVGTEGDGIWRHIGTTWDHQRRTAGQKALRGLPSNYIFDVYADTHERVWSIHLFADSIGIYEAGAWHTAFITPQRDELTNEPLIWLPANITAACYEPDRERIWIGTGAGEIGWLDVTVTNQMKPPRSTTMYTPRQAHIK